MKIVKKFCSNTFYLYLVLLLCLTLFIGCSSVEPSKNKIIKVTDVQVNENIVTVTYEDGYTQEIDTKQAGLFYRLLDDGTYGVGVLGCHYAPYDSEISSDSTTSIEVNLKSYYEFNNKKYEPFDYYVRPYVLNSLTELTILETINDMPVTQILEYGFANCEKLSKITIPDSIIKIDNSAFKNCSALSNISLSSAVSYIGSGVFSGCISLTEIGVSEENNIYSSIEGDLYDKSGTTFFQYAVGKKEAEVVIPDSVTRIMQGAFAGCDFIQKLTIPVLGSSQQTPERTSFNLLFETAHNEIVDYSSNHDLFINDTNSVPDSLQEVSLTSISELPDYAFGNCSSIKKIFLPETLTAIGAKAFSSCTSLEDVSIPESLTTVGDQAFGGCTSLKKIHLPKDISNIGRGIFMKCNSLEEITIPFLENQSGVDRFDRLAYYFDFHVYENVNDVIPKSLKKVTVTGGECIADNAFANCSYLTEIIIDGQQKTLCAGAFQNCSSLKKISLPNTLLSICEDCFKNCSQLSEITIPNSVITVQGSSFSGCPQIGKNIDDFIICDGWVLSVAKDAKELTVPENVKGIVPGIFFGCENLEHVTISFDGPAKSLSDLFIPSSLKSVTICGQKLPKDALKNCNTIEKIVVSDSVNTIEFAALADCTSLVDLTIPHLNFQSASASSSGFYMLFNRSLSSRYDVPTNIKAVTITKATSIPDKAFEHCSSIEHITFLGEITEIGKNAFSNCESLLSISFPETLQTIKSNAFSGCRALTEITIPQNVVLIQERAFSACSSLSRIVLEGEVETLEDNWFSQIGSMSSVCLTISSPEYYKKNKDQLDFASHIILREGNSIPEGAFKESRLLQIVEIPSTVTSIEASAFEGCTKLIQISIPDGVKSIGDQAFHGCRNLIKLELPEGVTAIGDRAFSGCTKLSEFSFSNSLEFLGNYAFAMCSALQSVDLSKTRLRSIEEHTFFNCSGLSELLLPPQLHIVGISAFEGCIGLKNISFPDSLQIIEQSAFHGCEGLIEIDFSNTLTIIKSNAFNGCKNLKNFSLPSTLTILETAAFANCTEITQVVIPSGVTSISHQLFKNCSKLEKISIPSDILFLGFEAFDGCDNLSYNVKNGIKYLGNAENPYLIAIKILDYESTEVEIDQSCNFIYSSAFQNATRLTAISFPKKMLSIGSHAFSGCIGLTHLSLPESLLSIDSYAFSGCINLTEITMSQDLEAISFGAFSDCTGLVKVEFFGDVSFLNMGAAVFKNCTSLTEVVFGDYVIMNSSVFENCTSLTNVMFLNDGLLTGEAIFKNCTALESIVIPEKTYRFERNIFEDCSNLREIYIPGAMEYIFENSFAGCINLERINYGGTVEQWNSMEKGDGWNKDFSCVVYCSNGTITL